MTSQELVAELNTCLGAAAQDKNEFLSGLDQLAKKLKKAKKDLVRMLKKETSKPKRKELKKKLRKAELAYQNIV